MIGKKILYRNDKKKMLKNQNLKKTFIFVAVCLFFFLFSHVYQTDLLFDKDYVCTMKLINQKN